MHVGFGMDNPTYDKCQGTPTLNNMTINHGLEREFENPIYSDEIIETGHNINSASKTTSQLQNTSHYEGVYFESTTVNETLHEGADNGVQGAHGNGTTNSTGNGMEASDGVIMKGATSEGVNELPPNLDDAGTSDENCYSTLDPTYSQLQARLRVPKPGVEIQSPQNNDDYSRLQYT